MATARLTLQNRIVTLLIISSVFFVAVFTLIQVNHQITNLNRYIYYQASLSSNIVKNNLEATLRQVNAEEAAKYLEVSLRELKDADTIKEAMIFDREGKIIAATKEGLVGSSGSYSDIARFNELDSSAKSNNWLITKIDKQKRNLELYIAIRLDPQGQIDYLVKLSFPLSKFQEALLGVYMPVIISILAIILMNILLGYLLSRTVVGPLKVLNNATKIIAAGDLLVRAHINTKDELQELGETFNFMAGELVKMKEHAENANPLTKLPGNIVIREEIERRIKGQKKFAAIYCDLDNFKVFNDKYGIAKGDEAIILISAVLKEAVRAKGNTDDFVGHEGGDDFFLLTTPERVQAIADYIIAEFDHRVSSLYNPEDVKRGYIESLSRDRTVKQFPIMSVSLSGVSNENRGITSYAEVTNIAAEVKKKAKANQGSIFVLDQRGP
jgi:diguanylate cyclase (GGDEF)-like protein